MMTRDAATARQVAASTGQLAQASTARATETRSEVQQLGEQRQQKWNALLAWAANHRMLREQVQPTERE